MVKKLTSQAFAPAEPLWKRVPTRDLNGCALSDFMILVPRIGKASAVRQREVMDALQAVVDQFTEELVFIDLNLKNNLLWVSTHSKPGVMLAFASAFRSRVPEALLIANQAELLARSESRPRRGWWRLPRWVKKLPKRLT